MAAADSNLRAASQLTVTRALSLLVALTVSAVLAGTGRHGDARAESGDLTQVVVELAAPPLARSSGANAAQRVDDEQRRFTRALRAIPGASVHWRYRLVVNGMSVLLPRAQLGRLSGLPGVQRVHEPATYHVLVGPDAATIRARDVPGSTLASAGDGVKIGVIDDGIDQRHPFFDPTGYAMPAGFPKGQIAYTTAKVIVARAFAPPGTSWPHAGKPFDPRAVRPRDARRRHRSRQREHARRGHAGQRDRAAGVHRQLQGAHRPTDADVGLDGNAPEIVAAIEAAVSDGMDVINLSIGEPEIEPTRDLVALALDAAAAAGVVPVVAAGNDYDDFGEGSLASPGSSASAITVGASTSGASPSITGFSSAGPTPISLRLKPDVVAPGSSILSAAPDDWRSSSGTSMAAPHVAGAVALLLQRHPEWTPADVKAALTATARPVTAGGVLVGPTRAGAGLVDVAAADDPLVAPSPTALSFGLVKAGSTAIQRVTVDDAGGGAGAWVPSLELAAVPTGTTIAISSELVVPGELELELRSGTTEGVLWGVVVLRRENRVRRIPVWGRVAVPRLTVTGAAALARPGTYRGEHVGAGRARRRLPVPELPATGSRRAASPGPSRCSASASHDQSPTSVS